MSVRQQGTGIVLEGDCPVEDAEALAGLLREPTLTYIDWTGARKVHTAVVQVLLAARRSPIGPCGDAFVARWIEPHVVAASGVKR